MVGGSGEAGVGREVVCQEAWLPAHLSCLASVLPAPSPPPVIVLRTQTPITEGFQKNVLQMLERNLS